MRRLVILSAATFALTACAQTGTPGSAGSSDDRAASACFRPQQVINFRAGEAQNVYLRALGGEVFELRSAGCLDLERSNALSVTPAAGFSNRLCVGDSAEIQVRDATIRQGRCSARVTRRLAEAEVEALPSRYRP